MAPGKQQGCAKYFRSFLPIFRSLFLPAKRVQRDERSPIFCAQPLRKPGPLFARFDRDWKSTKMHLFSLRTQAKGQGQERKGPIESERLNRKEPPPRSPLSKFQSQTETADFCASAERRRRNIWRKTSRIAPKLCTVCEEKRWKTVVETRFAPVFERGTSDVHNEESDS